MGVEASGEDASPASSLLLVGSALAVCSIVATCLAVASVEWFTADDFKFLAHVQHPDWSWWGEVFPFGQRYHWAYRPLGVQTFFYLGHSAFGLDAFGYSVANLTVLLGTSALVYGLALGLGCDKRAALLAGLLALSRAPSLAHVFSASGFQYFAAAFFYALTLWLFLVHEQSRRPGARLACCLALVAGLLCHEIVVTLPALLFAAVLHRGGFALSAGSLRRALGRVLPQLAIVGSYSVLRLGLLRSTHMGWTYTPDARVANVFGNAAALFANAAGGAWLLLAALVLLLAGLIGLRASPRGRDLVRHWLLPLNAFCLLWMAAVAAPFLLAPVAAPRFSMLLEAPVCLVMASYLSALFAVHGRRFGRSIELLGLALVFASLPYATLARKYTDPLGAQPRRFAEFIETYHPALPQGSTVVLVFGSPGLADPAAAMRFQSLSYGGTGVIRTLQAGLSLRVFFQDLSEDPRAQAICRDCRYIEILADGTFADDEDRSSGNVLALRGLESKKAMTVSSAARWLVHERGRAALPLILEASESLSEKHRDHVIRALLLDTSDDAHYVAQHIAADPARFEVLELEMRSR